MENPQKFKYFLNIFQVEQRAPPTQIIQWSKKCRIRFIRSVVIKKASQEEQQRPTRIRTNLNYIQNFMSILKNKQNLLARSK